jgi:hypothetical protein
LYIEEEKNPGIIFRVNRLYRKLTGYMATYWKVFTKSSYLARVYRGCSDHRGVMGYRLLPGLIASHEVGRFNRQSLTHSLQNFLASENGVSDYHNWSIAHLIPVSFVNGIM